MNVTLFRPINRTNNMPIASTKCREKSLINSTANSDTVSFCNTSALADELINIAKQAKKIRLEELHPSHINVFVEGNKYSVSEIPTLSNKPSVFRIKKDIGGKGEDISFVDVAEDLYRKTVAQLKEISIPKILQRKGFEQGTVKGLIEELAHRIENREIVYHDSSKKVKYGKVANSEVFMFRNDPKNLLVNYVEMYIPKEPKVHKLELVDHNECKNSFILQNKDDINLAKRIFLPLI